MTTEVLGSTANAPTAWIPDDSTFGARLALIRQRMAWGNVKEAAMACGLPPESWRTWERDGVEPRGVTRVAKKVADATGCDYGWLIGGRALAGRRATGDVATPWYGQAPERVTTPKRRPPDNRPRQHAGQQPADRHPRRTARVPRAGRS